MTEQPGGGFLDSSTLPLVVAFLLALGFLGLVVAIVSGGGDSGASAAATTTATTPRPPPSPRAAAEAKADAVRVGLTLAVAGDGRGKILVEGKLRDCSEECRLRFEQGESVRLSARPMDGSTFVGWTGSCGSPRVCVVEMDESRSVTALFSLDNPATAPSSSEPECDDDFDNDGDGDLDDNDYGCIVGETEDEEDPLLDVPPPAVAPPPPATITPPPPPPPVLAPEP